MGAALNIIKTAFELIIKNWFNIIQIISFPSLIILGIFAALSAADKTFADGSLLDAMLALSAVLLWLCHCWIAVSFHRHILLGEESKWFPEFDFHLNVRYLWRGLLIILILLPLAFIPFFITKLFKGIPFLVFGATLPVNIILAWIVARISLILVSSNRHPAIIPTKGYFEDARWKRISKR